MKIALINTDDFTGGAAVACIRLAQSLALEGIEVDILTMNESGKNILVQTIGKGYFYRLKAKLNFYFERLYFYFFEKNKQVRFAFSPANFGFDITSKINFNKYDVIHLHWVNFGFFSLNSIEKLFKINKPIVWTMHDMWPFTGGCHHSGDCLNFETGCGNCSTYLRKPAPNDISFQQFKRKKEIYESTQNLTFVGCSQWISNRAKNSFALKKASVFDIPNPIDLSIFNEIKVSKSYLNIETHKKVILFAAMKVSVIWKGFYLLKEAFIHLKSILNEEDSTNIELVVAGDANPEDFIDFPFKCHLVGRINSPEEMNKIYNIADIFVSSSIQENLPNTIMEAMATGTPCVGFSVGGIPEMIDHKENGYVANPLDAMDLAVGMDWCLQNDIYKSLSFKAKTKAKDFYDQAIVASKYKNLYLDLMKKKIQ